MSKMSRLSSTMYPLLAGICLSCILLVSKANAQKENNIWYFGDHAGLDFNSGKPVARTDGQLNTDEGCATMCDRNTGALLFYTDGVSVWNNRHQKMPRGNNTLHGYTHSAQSALILPMPCDSTKFYIFTAPGLEDSNVTRGMFYSIVDMTKDGGRGDLIMMNKQLLDFATEQMTAVLHRSGKDYWIITHGLHNNKLFAYRLSEFGIDTLPVVSATGAVHNGTFNDKALTTIGPMVASPDGRHLASAMSQLCELYDFDDSTGFVSNGRRLTIGTGEYGACFSPDNKKLYFSAWQDQGYIVQFDITAGNTTAIQNTMKRINILDIAYPGGMQLGPDGRIYVAKEGKPVGIGVGDSTLGVIQNPNMAGYACVYVDHGVNLATGLSIAGLPNIVTSSYVRHPLLDVCTLMPVSRFYDQFKVCGDNCITLSDSSYNGATSYVWSFPGSDQQGSTDQNPGKVCYSAPGKYVISLTVSNARGSDVSTRTVFIPKASGIISTYSLGRLVVNVGSGVDLPIVMRFPDLGVSPNNYKVIDYIVQFDQTQFSVDITDPAKALTVPAGWNPSAIDLQPDGLHVTLTNAGNGEASNNLQLGTLHLLARAGGAPTYPILRNLVIRTADSAYSFCGNVEGDRIAVLNVPVDGIAPEAALANAITVFPNPVKSNGTLQLQYTGAASVNSSVQLYDEIGKEVLVVPSIALHPHAVESLPLGTLEKGVYYLRVSLNGTTVTKKITVTN